MFLFFYCFFSVSRTSLGKLWINNYPSRDENSCWQLSIFTPIINHFLLLIWFFIFCLSLLQRSLIESLTPPSMELIARHTLAVAWIVSGARHSAPRRSSVSRDGKVQSFSFTLETISRDLNDLANEWSASLRLRSSWGFLQYLAILAPLLVVIVAVVI